MQDHGGLPLDGIRAPAGQTDLLKRAQHRMPLLRRPDRLYDASPGMFKGFTLALARPGSSSSNSNSNRVVITSQLLAVSSLWCSRLQLIYNFHQGTMLTIGFSGLNRPPGSQVSERFRHPQ